MSWFKVDDGFYRNPKTAMLSDGATALWLRAATWSCDMLTDGVVPQKMLPLFQSTEVAAKELCDAGLWETTRDGWLFHDWFDYQPSAQEVEELRKKRSEAGRKGGKLSARSRIKASAQASDQAKPKQTPSKTEAKSNPVSVPVPHKEETSKDVSKKKNNIATMPERKPRTSKTLIADDWQPNETNLQTAQRVHANVDLEAQKFRAWAQANARRYANWHQAFNNWLLNSSNFNKQQTGYVNKAQQRYEQNMQRVRAAERLEQTQPQLTNGGSDNDFGF